MFRSKSGSSNQNGTSPPNVSEPQLEINRTDQQGQLFVRVKESRSFQLKNNFFTSDKNSSQITGLLSENQAKQCAYCILQIEQQQVQTSAVERIKTTDKELSFEPWDEGHTFDVTSDTSVLVVTMLTTCTYSSPPIHHNGNDSTSPPPPYIDNTRGTILGKLSIPIIALTHQKPIDQWLKLSITQDSPSRDLIIPGELHLKLQYNTTVKKVTVDDFVPLKVVGKGTFAKVMLVRKVDTHRLYAMKVINKDSVIKHNAVKHTLSERNILKKIDHPFIVSLKYSFQTEDKLYMVLDYICGGELFYHLSEAERFTEDRARFYAAEIVSALGYLHKLNIIYRDLKPENLLLDMNGHICLTDFGLCKEGLGYGDVTHTFCGSPEYLAPEIFLGIGYDRGVDWWALGTLLYEMLAGLPPFFSDDIEEMNERIIHEPLTFPPYFSNEAKSLLAKLLDRNPKRRLGSGITDAQEIMNHPFFKGMDWEKLEKKQIEAPLRPAIYNEMDVRFFDPESTKQVARLSFHESNLTSQQQEAFLGFSYCAPESEIAKRSKRRSSSGSRHQMTGPVSEEPPMSPGKSTVDQQIMNIPPLMLAPTHFEPSTNLTKMMQHINLSESAFQPLHSANVHIPAIKRKTSL